MPKRLKITKGFLNNQSINEVVGLNIAYSNSNYGGKSFPSAYINAEPQGIAYDTFGNLWAVDNYRVGILMYPPQNQFNGQPATFIIGQPNLNVNGSNYGITQSAMKSPELIAFDKNNNLWVYDSSRNGIIGFQYPFGSGGILNASWVIGQTSFTTSAAGVSANLFSTAINGIVFDNQNNLWVSDTGNNRVIGFSASKIYSINPSASWVIGQPSFTANIANNGGISAKTLYKPYSVAIDKNGYLWVGDNSNNRVLGYKNPQGIMLSADYVIGQSIFTSNTAATTQNGFYGPYSIAFDSLNNLWIFDQGNHCIKGFNNTNIYTNGSNASWIMFQNNFTTNNTATLSQQYTMQYDMAGFFYQTTVPNEEIVTTLPNPYQFDYSADVLYLAFDKNNNLWISDTGYYRILKYDNSDITSNAYPYNCSAVLGQSQFYIKGQSGETQYYLNYVSDVAFDKNNNLWITDNFSVKGFQYPTYSQQIMQNWAIGGTFTTSNGLTQNGLSAPQGISFDNFGDMFVVDGVNNRIMGFSANSLYGNNAPNAFVVIGQTNFTTGTAATTQNGLNNGAGSVYYKLSGKPAFDSNNNMYVADVLNNRIMVFPYGSGFTNGMNASIVIGQTSFTTLTSGSTMSTLNNPVYCIFDNFGNLWVSDWNNNRVQKFVPPFTTGMSATVSITGFNRPLGLAFDGMGNLFVADNTNNRILGFPSSVLNASTTVSSATIILGQPNLTQVTAGLGLQALNYPQGLAINPATGDLICADNQNNRIVGWYYLHKQTSSNALDSKYIFYNE